MGSGFQRVQSGVSWLCSIGARARWVIISQRPGAEREHTYRSEFHPTSSFILACGMFLSIFKPGLSKVSQELPSKTSPGVCFTNLLGISQIHSHSQSKGTTDSGKPLGWTSCVTIPLSLSFGNAEPRNQGDLSVSTALAL